MKYQTPLLTVAFLLLSSPLASFGQKTYDPNLNHYYMGRQQITITDETPMINDKTGGAAGGAGANGGLPGRPTALPRSGFQSYSPETPPTNTKSLPKLVNGVPPKAPPPQASGHKAKPGKLALNKSSHKPPTPNPSGGPSAYKPYETYGAPTAAAPTAASSSAQKSSSNVRGNLLHWARGRHN